jgi:methyl-accepting chemotaxis protein
MKIRTKLVSGAIAVILVPMILSAGVMGVLVQRQNNADVKQRSAKLLDTLRKQLDREAQDLMRELTGFAQDPDLLSNITYLSQQAEGGAGVARELSEFYKTQLGSVLAHFARVDRYHILMLFDKAGELVVYVRFDEDQPLMGIVSEDDTGLPIVKTVSRERVISGEEDPTPEVWSVIDLTESVPLVSTEPVQEPTHALKVFEDQVALWTAVPIRNQQTDEQSPALGELVGYRYLSQNFVAHLSEQAQAQVNVFVDSQPYVGTLPALTDIPTNRFEQLRQVSQTTPEQPYLYFTQEIEGQPYYQVYYPLIQDHNDLIRSTLVLSISKTPTNQKTRQAVILQCLVSLCAVLIIIPVAFWLAGKVARPVQSMAAAAEAIANGRIDQEMTPLRSNDEFGRLSRSFVGMVAYLRNMAALAEHLSHGEIRQEITPKTEHDMLGMAYARMTKYFNTLARIAERIQEGDLTGTVEVQSEQDVLGKTFNAMLGHLQDLVHHIRSRARELADAGTNIAQASETTSRNSDSQADSVEVTSSSIQEMASNIASIVQNIRNESTSISQVRSAAGDIQAAGRDVVNEVEQVSTFARETGTAIEQMGGSLEDIYHQVQSSAQVSQQVVAVAQKGTTQINQLTTEMHTIHDHMGVASEAILRLQRQSQTIQDILNVIHNVVDQTNMLALNASIIAAQAGEHGRAFGVVADEVKALADQTGQSVKEISQFLKTLQTELTETVNAIGTSAISVETGLQLSEQTEQLLHEMATGVEQSADLITTTEQDVKQHTQASQHVQQAIDGVIEQLRKIRTRAQTQQTQSSTIEAETKQLAAISEEIEQATEQQSTAAHQIVDTMTNMSSAVQENSQHADQLAELAIQLSVQAQELVGLVEQFKIRE